MTASHVPSPRRPSLLYWLWLAWVVLIWLMSLGVVSMGLKVALRGRLVGGAGINVFVAVFLLVALSMATSLLMATWKLRLTGDPGVWSLIRQSKPSEPRVAAVWFWARVTGAAWLLMAVLMLLFVVLGRAGALSGVRP